MESQVTRQLSGSLHLEHTLRKGGRDHTLEVIAENTLSTPPEGSPEHHFKEHDIGFGVNHRGETLYYLVEHPIWKVRTIRKMKLDADFGLLYGDKWSLLNQLEPRWSLYAEGSPVKVYQPGRITSL
jgi:hypothetical protein